MPSSPLEPQAVDHLFSSKAEGIIILVAKEAAAVAAREAIKVTFLHFGIDMDDVDSVEENRVLFSELREKRRKRRVWAETYKKGAVNAFFSLLVAFGASVLTYVMTSWRGGHQ